MEKIFVCSDLHFHHKNIIVYENRPWPNRDAMDEGLIANWNSVVDKEDTVFFLGDVSFSNRTLTSNLVHRLSGHKILIRGNHDMGRSIGYWKDVGFEEIYNSYYLKHDGVDIFMNHTPPDKPHEGIFWIYGHVHGDPAYPNWTPDSACVCMERIGYRPALLDEVLSGAAYSSL